MNVPAFAPIPAEVRRRAGRQRMGRLLWNSVIMLLVLAGAVAIIAPVLWTVSVALESPSQLALYPPRLFPFPLHWGNFVRAWEAAPFSVYLRNSVEVTALAVLGTTASSFVVAYGFARFRGRGRNALFVILLSTMMIPPQVTMIPTFILMRYLHWINTFNPLWVPGCFATSGFNVFLLRQFITSIPKELDEAAVLDGANQFQILTRVILPSSLPAIITVALLSFVWNWTNFMGPLIYLNSPSKWTLPLGLMQFSQQFNPMPNIMVAASLLITLPILVVFFLSQKHFMRGINLGGRALK
ncbi:MAG: carbohydrate ABC transporter permease [Bacilli bacterium]